jgi:hypothetical protein
VATVANIEKRREKERERERERLDDVGGSDDDEGGAREEPSECAR